MWDESLNGKQVFFADNIVSLKDRVNYVVNDGTFRDTCTYSDDEEWPFADSGLQHWKFCYYDSLYDYKLAFKQGKKVQCKLPISGWTDIGVNGEHVWDYNCDYRIVVVEKDGLVRYLTYEDLLADEQLLSNAQLSRWLANGNGMWKLKESKQCKTKYDFDEVVATYAVNDDVRVRMWDDTEWHKPTMNYCFPKEKMED